MPVCEHCGKAGHTKDTCYKKSKEERARREKQKAGKLKVASVQKSSAGKQSEGEGREAEVPSSSADSQVASGSGGESSSSSLVSSVSVVSQDRTLLYTPITVGGVRFPRALVDTGSEVDLLPMREVQKHGLTYSPGGVKVIKGYDGTKGAVAGSLTCGLSFGPRKEEKRVEFLVCPKLGVPIISCGTLRSFGYAVDCMNSELCDVASGDTVKCSHVSVCQKN